MNTSAAVQTLDLAEGRTLSFYHYVELCSWTVVSSFCALRHIHDPTYAAPPTILHDSVNTLFVLCTTVTSYGLRSNYDVRFSSSARIRPDSGSARTSSRHKLSSPLLTARLMSAVTIAILVVAYLSSGSSQGSAIPPLD